jgi:hypothetical protein
MAAVPLLLVLHHSLVLVALVLPPVVRPLQISQPVVAAVAHQSATVLPLRLQLMVPVVVAVAPLLVLLAPVALV